MIGSLMSRMGMAEKLSIPQLQKAIQDGTLPAYVGIPLLQQKVQEQKQAQAMVAPQQPPIAQQVMGEAQGIEAAQSNLPAEGFAPGGIVGYDPDGDDGYAGGGMVAFAEGDLVDDDEEDDDSTPDYFDRLNAAAQSEQEDLMRQYAAGMKEIPQGIGAIGISLDRPTGTGIRPEAKAPSGIEALEARVLRQESGGRRYDDKGKLLTSSKGAEGEMQVMPMTQRDPGFGVTPAKDDSPEEKARVGRDYLRALYKRYGGDEQLTLMAYNWGPGNVDKYLKSGRDIAMVPQETRKYASLAEGGIASIKRYAGKDSSLVEDDTVYDQITGMPLYGSQTTKPGVGSIAELVQPGYKPFDPKEWEKQFGSKKETEDWAKFDAATADFEKEREAQIKQDEENARLAEKVKEDEAKAADAAKKVEAETPAAKMQAYLDKMAGRIEKQREQDRYMSLLAAGLGMMGGTSPNAAANIGQGAMKGIEAQMAANKMAAAQEAALTKGQLGAYQLQQTDATRKMLQAQGQEAKYLGMMKDARTRALGAIVKAKGLDISSLDQNQLAKLEQETDLFLANDPGYQALYKKVYPEGLPSIGKVTPAPVNYSQTYGLTPKK